MQGKGTMMRIELSQLELDPSAPLRRQMPRSLEQRQPGYESEFDFLTVFYDCFASVDNRSFICVGPPLYELDRTILSALNDPFLGKRRHNHDVFLPSILRADFVDSNSRARKNTVHRG